MTQDYETFVKKFEPKKTTDDCYTPPGIYDIIKDYVCTRWGINPDTIMRPFYPGGNYENEDYTGKVVVDNPPFSILSKIARFYTEKNIPFFIFGPGLTLCNYGFIDGVNLIFINVSIIYENGARVKTGFLTNLPACKIETAPDLSKKIAAAQKRPPRRFGVAAPSYVYRSADLMGRAGRGEIVKMDKCHFIRKWGGRPVFGAAVVDEAAEEAEHG